MIMTVCFVIFSLVLSLVIYVLYLATLNWKPERLLEALQQAVALGLLDKVPYQLRFIPYAFNQFPEEGSVAYFEDYLFLDLGDETKVYLVPELKHLEVIKIVQESQSSSEVCKALKLKEIKRFSLTFPFHYKTLNAVITDTQDKVSEAWFHARREEHLRRFSENLIELRNQIETGEISKEEASLKLQLGILR